MNYPSPTWRPLQNKWQLTLSRNGYVLKAGLLCCRLWHDLYKCMCSNQLSLQTQAVYRCLLGHSPLLILTGTFSLADHVHVRLQSARESAHLTFRRVRLPIRSTHFIGIPLVMAVLWASTLWMSPRHFADGAITTDELSTRSGIAVII